jgi:hypothetical protein
MRTAGELALMRGARAAAAGAVGSPLARRAHPGLRRRNHVAVPASLQAYDRLHSREHRVGAGRSRDSEPEYRRAASDHGWAESVDVLGQVARAVLTRSEFQLGVPAPRNGRLQSRRRARPAAPSAATVPAHSQQEADRRAFRPASSAPRPKATTSRPPTVPGPDRNRRPTEVQHRTTTRARLLRQPPVISRTQPAQHRRPAQSARAVATLSDPAPQPVLCSL